MSDSVEIREMILALPGVGRAEAAQVAEEIAARLSESVPGWRRGDLPAMVSLRVRLPRGVRRDEVARLVATEIERALR